MVTAAREEDKKTRMKEITETNLVFWARDMLIQAVSERIDRRKDLRSWSKKIVLDLVKKVPQVIRIKRIVENCSDDQFFPPFQFLLIQD